MLQRERHLSSLFVPVRSPAMAVGKPFRRTPSQLGEQHVADQRVHDVRPCGVYPAHEETTVLGQAQLDTCVLTPGQRRRETGIHHLDDREIEQRVHELGVLGTEDLVQHVTLEQKCTLAASR